MCGFVGFTDFTDLNKADVTVEKMMESIAHRGPNSDGKYVDGDVALGFRRLSIIDLEGGTQPIFNEDDSKVLVFNGEIYNFKPLREELISKGHKFKTNTDSEVLLHGYEEYGKKLPELLRGMFAFVIWDKNTKTLFGCRDMFGIKPFYYTFCGKSFVFGSELKAFKQFPDFKCELNREALEEYLSFQYSALDESFLKGVFRLRPGHCFTLNGGKMEIERYFTADFAPEDGTIEEYAEQIDKTMRESVEAHKISDVEVGSFLSSGIDSSYLVALARVDKTFTVGFADTGYSEIAYAEKFSEEIGIKNISKVITTEEFFSEFPNVQYHMDEPLADPSAVALYFVSQLASKYVKVVMSGEGADELFGGYCIYSEAFAGGAYAKLPFFIRRAVSKVCSLLPKKRGINFLVRQGQRLSERYIGNANMFSVKERNKLLKKPVGAPAPTKAISGIYDFCRGKDKVTTMQLVDINTWLIGDILLKADRMSMAHSLEVRVPYLDRKVLELASKIPVYDKVDATHTKMALRKAAADVLPEFTAQKKKLGFPVPIRVWLKQDKYYTLVHDAFVSNTARTYFNTERLIKLLDDHKNGKCDNSRKIWTVYTFIVWYSQFFDDENDYFSGRELI